MRRPGAGRVAASVSSVMRWNRNSLSRVVPVGMTSDMSRSRSTTRMAPDGSVVCYLQRMSVSGASEPPRESRPPLRPLERIASFRFAYLAIFVFLVAYVFTVEGLEEVLRRYYRAQVEAAVRVDAAQGPVAQQITSRVNALLQGSFWIRYGDVRVRRVGLAAAAR